MSKTKNVEQGNLQHSSPAPQTHPIKISDKLEVAYASLRNRFTDLNVELEETNIKLIQKILEIDFTTQYLDSILSNISQGILFVNVNGLVTTYNAAAERTLKVPAVKVLYHDYWSNFPDDYLGFSMRQVLREMKPCGTVFTKIETKKGNPTELEVETNFVVNTAKEAEDAIEGVSIDSMQGLIVLVRDITELRRLEVIAQRKNRMNELGEMASMVAHEIRNPLGGIKGFASLLERDLEDRPELKKMASYIIQGTDNLNDLVTRVLNYSRPMETQIKSADILPLIEELRSHVLTDEKYTQNYEITIECSEDSVVAPIDAQAMRSSILNLVLNAIQAMPNGGKVTISVEKDESHVIIKITDTGIGIPKENLKKIYSPFFTTRSDGNGFGLSEVHKVIQSHEGSIEVDSVENQGTTFTIKLPLKFHR